MATLITYLDCYFVVHANNLVNRLDFISYAEMLSLRKRGFRNGAFRRLPSLQRGLFSAALEYARLYGTIVNRKLLGMVRGVAEKFGKSLAQRIYDRGMERATAMFRNMRMGGFPRLRKWIACDSYIFWLGTDLLTRQRSWISFSPGCRQNQ
jgi:hypothetical protein